MKGDETVSVELKVGDRVPAFSLLNQDGERVESSSFKGRPWAIYFYPKASTPGCTTQSCAVRDALPDFSGLGAAVVGVSPDTPKRQKAFDEKQGLGFPLLCDEDHAVAEAFGAWGEKSMYGKTYMGCRWAPVGGVVQGQSQGYGAEHTQGAAGIVYGRR
jgi:peroxiredoxin Q/BCP